ncbi:hypothetical protein M885DRAFT_344413 [Pelagophyceae sp. CCMP2097]|nr:hypothetical protein M885DRAFT_344413 [Pelagophyceae sp. CCMP2097]
MPSDRRATSLKSRCVTASAKTASPLCRSTKSSSYAYAARHAPPSRRPSEDSNGGACRAASSFAAAEEDCPTNASSTRTAAKSDAAAAALQAPRSGSSDATSDTKASVQLAGHRSAKMRAASPSLATASSSRLRRAFGVPFGESRPPRLEALPSRDNGSAASAASTSAAATRGLRVMHVMH